MILRSSERSLNSSCQADIFSSGIEEALLLRAPMNRGGKRRRSDEEIIADVEELGILRGHMQSSLYEAEG